MGKNKSGKGKGLTKSAIYQELSDKSGASRKQVAAVFDSLGSMIKRSLKKDGDVITIPGLLRLKLRRSKSVKGGKTVPNPFRPGEMMVTKDKPAKNLVKAYAVKALKESVQ
jgi:nucleoid DNA-binding protein